MFKRLCVCIFCLLPIGGAYAAPIASVDYVVKYVKTRWNVDVPHAMQQKTNALDMRWLLGVVDYVNEQLNGVQTSNYALDEQIATTYIADATAANYAIETLVQKLEYPFEFVPAVTDTTFSFTISAKGTFYIDWGDGSAVDKIERENDVTPRVYKHTYPTAASNYMIGLDGVATGYSTDEETAAISFANTNDVANQGLKRIAGCLGCIFPTINDGTGAGEQPRFMRTFQYNRSLTGSITKDLFKGVRGKPVSNMFRGLFERCSSFMTDLPADLFVNLSGAPTKNLFRGAFRGWNGKRIPAGLFRTIKGAPQEYAYAAVFADCPHLEVAEDGLFDGLVGAPAEGLFDDAFSNDPNLKSLPTFGKLSGASTVKLFRRACQNCVSLQRIPENVFGNITGSTLATDAFLNTFDGCTALGGESAKINGKYLYEIWPSASTTAYNGAVNLLDYYCIPTAWGGPGKLSSCDPDGIKTDTFAFVPETSEAQYQFTIGAAGLFGVDWGDGFVQVVGQNSPGEMVLSHTYIDGKKANAHTVSIGGASTKYAAGTDLTHAAISFRANGAQVKSISGCLGCVFPTLPAASPSQPVFFGTFLDNTELAGTLPTNLFDGLQGQPVNNMFRRTFEGCIKAQWDIPAGFFKVSGEPTSYLFSGTFNEVPLKSIDANVFYGLSGPVQGYMFNSTFANNPNLTEVPAGLFSDLTGNAASAFQYTFQNDTGLTTLPDGLFDSLDYSADMFVGTFDGCTGLTVTPFSAAQ